MNPEALTILAMIVCVILSGYFSATETAFSSLNRTRIKTMAENGNKRAKLVYALSEKYDKLISTILIGNNIVNIALASLGTVLFVQVMGDIGATVSTVIVTVVVLIFGEISPKSIAKDCPEKFAMFAAPLLNVLMIVLTPLNFLFSQWKKLLAKLLKVQENDKMSQEELLTLVDEVQQEGSIDTEEGSLLRNAIEFNDLMAEDVLTPRVSVEAVSDEADKEEIARVFSQTKYSRLPVYHESIDKVIGVIHQKDFYTGTGITQKPLEEIMAPAVFVHMYEKVDDLLRLLQKNKAHMAVVVDEYGGTLGIVTMEDILEELVGDIWDEHDEVVEQFKQLSEKEYRVDCTVNFEDFCQFFDLKTESESVTLSGWIMERLERVPEINDAFDFEFLHVTVTETGAHCATFVNVTIGERTEEEE